MIFRPFNRVLDGSRKAYSFFVSFLVRRALVTLLLFGGACCAVWLLFGKIDSSFLPSEDKGEIMCNIELPQGASWIGPMRCSRSFWNGSQGSPESVLRW